MRISNNIVPNGAKPFETDGVAANSEAPTPWLIQGGMGISISGWPLARAVSRAGQLGVVSGTAINSVFIRRLQDQGIDDTLRAILDRFPLTSVVDEVVDQFAASRRRPTSPYRNTPMLTLRSSQRSIDLLVLSTFVEVALAREGHSGIVGINLLTKVQIPTVPTLYGAILAGVDYVLMGAGVPTHIPGILERLALNKDVDLPLQIVGGVTPDETPTLHFDPTRYNSVEPLVRPKFIGIVSSHVLATALAKRSSGPVDGFVVERPSAGGHNAPPRGQFALDDDGNPHYGDRDRIDYEVLRGLGAPFWIGGGVTNRARVEEALALGAAGVQVGTLFAYCRESGMDPTLRKQIIDELRVTDVAINTSMRASPTGYPFKVARVEGTIADHDVYSARERKCDLGFLREAFVKSDGTFGYRCAAEPVDAFVKKGGQIEDTVDCTCLCNGLMSTCGLGQVRAGGREEPPIVTSGDCIDEIRGLLAGRESYGANDVIAMLAN